jgi:hypothetical protein
MKAKTVLIAMIVSAIIPCSLLAQEYVEASGQTNVFDLKAGAKAGWNTSGSGILYTQKIDNIRIMNIRLNADRKSISITTSGARNLSFDLFSVNGTRIIRTPVAGQSPMVLLKSPLLPGYYLARMKSNGLTIHTTTFFVSR